MQTTILNEIISFILGRRYYANIVRACGTTRAEICSYLFTTREEADRHARQIALTRSFEFIQTISFRSRKDL